MKKELQQKLYDKYPELFAQHAWDMTKTCMCWGISVEDGWYNIINNLCSEIMSYCAINKIDIPEFSQIKEKFGLLRIYVDNADDYIWALIEKAEDDSAHVCEHCGVFGPESGVTTEGVWLLTLCKKCRNERHGEGNDAA